MCPGPLPAPRWAHSPVDRSILGFLLIAGAEVHQGVQVGLQKHVLQPGHVALEGRGTQEPYNPPEGRHHGEALVGDGSEGHHHGQLPLGIISAAFQEASNVLIHLWSKLELARVLQESGTALTDSPTSLFHHRIHHAQQVPLPCPANISCPTSPMLACHQHLPTWLAALAPPSHLSLNWDSCFLSWGRAESRFSVQPEPP